MRRILIAIITVMVCASLGSPLWARPKKVEIVPSVEYLAPENDSVVDITGKQTVVFGWRQYPVPSGGRWAYRFMLFTGKGKWRNLIVREILDRSVVLFEVPAYKLQNGVTYTWCVQQRDEKNHAWSVPETRRFKVVKKK